MGNSYITYVQSETWVEMQSLYITSIPKCWDIHISGYEQMQATGSVVTWYVDKPAT